MDFGLLESGKLLQHSQGSWIILHTFVQLDEKYMFSILALMFPYKSRGYKSGLDSLLGTVIHPRTTNIVSVPFAVRLLWGRISVP